MFQNKWKHFPLEMYNFRRQWYSPFLLGNILSLATKIPMSSVDKWFGLSIIVLSLHKKLSDSCGEHDNYNLASTFLGTMPSYSSCPLRLLIEWNETTL